ncbi:mycothiol-dependent nitroreductase Rv2466c family protein [Brachybacterium tyrofermentans]|uniref:mycothiol-dependent nitroreductase Rv2466c family protein n=1 Tax=Brachybacterium tyrofermentans TaxID=47848 RepID=UPI003FD4A4F6
MSARPVELFVDPVCPFAWMTSRWLLEAATVRDIAPTYSVMSLSVLNEGRDLDADYRRMLDDSWGPARLAVEIVSTQGSDAFSRWYTAWGERYHVGGQQDDRRAVAVAALEVAELPAELIGAYEPVAGDATDVALRASHDGAISRVGDEVGTPVISFGDAGTAVSGTAVSGTAYFGPVVSPAPKGEDAGRLLDALETLSSLEGFYELKRSRTGGVDFS